MNLPPPNCPNEQACLTLQPRIQKCEESSARQDKALERIGADLDTVKKEVHEIRVVLRERDKLGGFLQMSFASIIGILILNLGASIWWASSISEKLESSVGIVEDHEDRLRQAEDFIRKNGGKE